VVADRGLGEVERGGELADTDLADRLTDQLDGASLDDGLRG
jgi:hypothetical protein